MITDAQDDGFNITTNDVDSEQFLSMSHDPVGGIFSYY